MPSGRKRARQATAGSFGALLLELREAQQVTVSDLAAKSGVKRNYITMLETGERTAPSANVVRQLAGALDELPLKLKVAAGIVEFWDLYPVNLDERPMGRSLSDLSEPEEVKLLWFLEYLRSTGA